MPIGCPHHSICAKDHRPVALWRARDEMGRGPRPIHLCSDFGISSPATPWLQRAFFDFRPSGNSIGSSNGGTRTQRNSCQRTSIIRKETGPARKLPGHSLRHGVPRTGLSVSLFGPLASVEMRPKFAPSRTSPNRDTLKPSSALRAAMMAPATSLAGPFLCGD